MCLLVFYFKALIIDPYNLYRVALSWFPQLYNQFPFLRILNTITEPYLKVFRQTIPPIGGIDISAIPAFFMLDILSNTAVALGAEIPTNFPTIP